MSPKNAILLIDNANQRRQEGVDRADALTSPPARSAADHHDDLAMIFGMVPLALALGEAQFALRWRAVIGGLISSTLLTLVVVPVVYVPGWHRDVLHRLWTKGQPDSAGHPGWRMAPGTARTYGAGDADCVTRSVIALGTDTRAQDGASGAGWRAVSDAAATDRRRRGHFHPPFTLQLCRRRRPQAGVVSPPSVVIMSAKPTPPRRPLAPWSAASSRWPTRSTMSPARFRGSGRCTKHLPLIHEGRSRGVRILCYQVRSSTVPSPLARPPLVRRRRAGARPHRSSGWRSYRQRYGMAMVVPVYERALASVYYNFTAAVPHFTMGPTSGKYRKIHIPRRAASGKSTSSPATSGIRCSKLSSGVTIGVYICYDRHFPEGAQALGLRGAEIVFNPRATVAGLSQYLMKLGSRRTRWPTAVMGCINRVGTGVRGTSAGSTAC